MGRAGSKLTSGAITNRLRLTSGYLLKLVQSLGKEQEPTSVYPGDEKPMHDNRDDGRDDDRDLVWVSAGKKFQRDVDHTATVLGEGL